MKKINNDIIDNEKIVDYDEKSDSIDITSDQIITLDDIDNEINGNIEMTDSSENIEINDIDESIEEISNELKFENEVQNPIEVSSNDSNNNDESLEITESKNDNDLSFMSEIKNPIKHANDEYALKNVLKTFNNGELEYMEEMKQKIYNRKELIHIYPRMFFWRKWKAKKINAQIIMEMEMEFQENYQNVLAIRNEYKAKIKEYEHKQRIYKESLFKL